MGRRLLLVFYKQSDSPKALAIVPSNSEHADAEVRYHLVALYKNPQVSVAKVVELDPDPEETYTLEIK